MARRAAPSLLALGLLFHAAACGETERRDDRLGEATEQAVHLVDASGRELVLPVPARRVVSLVPSATESLRAMGRGDVIVGRTDYDRQPWAAAIPSVGGGIEPNVEAVVALRPDLVVRFAGEQDTRTPARLDELGIQQLAVRPDRIEDIYRTVELLGRAIGDSAAAASLVASIRAGLEHAAAGTRSLPRTRFMYVLGGSPPWVAGPGTYIDEVLSLLGGENAFADLETLYSAVSPEEVRSRRVDVVLVSDVAGFDPALAPGARVEVVGGALEMPGPGVVDAAHLMAERLHGRTPR
jgi:iron complex transport system substrate-binding protein